MAIAISFCEMEVAKIGKLATAISCLSYGSLSIVEMLFCVRIKVYIFKFVLDHIKINRLFDLGSPGSLVPSKINPHARSPGSKCKNILKIRLYIFGERAQKLRARSDSLAKRI